MTTNTPDQQAFDDASCRHILSLSGGKDSTALALYMRDRIPQMEYVFCDTGEELSETYAYLLKIEAQLGVEITRLNPDRQFSHYLDLYRGVLPDPRTRWCTRMLKLRPFESYVGDDPVYLYVGIRADEAQRKGYVSTKPNITTRFPFVDDGITHSDVMRLLDESGLGLPDYYSWRSRSGCYFCFYQQIGELLCQDGIFLNADHVGSSDSRIQKAWEEREGVRFCIKIKQPANPEILATTNEFIQNAVRNITHY